jgi:translation elongation factor EF-1alpha
MAEKEIGEVFSYYSKIGVAAIKINGSLKKGDKIHIKGSTTDFEQTLDSMQIEHKSVDKAKKGDDLGIKVIDRVRPGDKIYKA